MVFLTISIILWGVPPAKTTASEIIATEFPPQSTQLVHSPCQGSHTPVTAEYDLPHFILVLPHQAPFP